MLSICVEVCSAAMYLDNDPGVLISACLFGDGAGPPCSPTLRIRNETYVEEGQRVCAQSEPSDQLDSSIRTDVT